MKTKRWEEQEFLEARETQTDKSFYNLDTRKFFLFVNAEYLQG